MIVMALIVGLVLERLVTSLLHLRELRLFDGYYDAGLRRIERWPRWTIGFGLVLMVAGLVLPVLLVSLLLSEEGWSFWNLWYFMFAVLIVLFCLGPRDLGSEVDDYGDAKDRGDDDAADRILLEMSESADPRKSDVEVVEEAIFVQSNNRIFGVIFWFFLLGPVGAWMFRVSDMLRRRVVYEHRRSGEGRENVLIAIEAIYGLLKWIPARLAMFGYALSGSFDDAMNAWRSELDAEGKPIDERNDMLIARVGKAAMTGYLDEPANSGAAAQNAMRIVRRTVFFWISVIALLTLFGWTH
jgi:membrane protein required for beta-lactamase induction